MVLQNLKRVKKLRNFRIKIRNPWTKPVTGKISSKPRKSIVKRIEIKGASLGAPKQDTFFGTGTEKIQNKEWDWETFQTTEGFPVSNNLLDWVIGQDRVLDEVRLALDEWLYKLKYLQRVKWYRPWLQISEEKANLNRVLTPGPYLLLLGDPGTGKSLIGRAMAEHLTRLYQKNKIKRFDVLCWPNRIIAGNPRISIHPSGKGEEIVKIEKKKLSKKSFFKSLGFKAIQWTILGLGLALLGICAYIIFVPWLLNAPVGTYNIPVQILYGGDFFSYLVSMLLTYFPLLGIGATMLFSGFFVFYLTRMLGDSSGRKGIGGAEATEAPKILVNNTGKFAPFIDATGHTSAQLFGSIAWDPYQRYSEDTLVLTPKGWKWIKEIHEGELVFTLNRITNLIEIQPVSWKVSSEVHGKIVHFKNAHCDLMVDKEHAIYNARNKTRERAGNFIDKEVMFSRTGTWIGEEISKSDEFLKFIAWYLSEGSSFIDTHHRRINISQVKRNNIPYLKELTDSLGLKASYIGHHWRVHHARLDLWNYVHSLGNSLTKFIPLEIKNASRRQLSLFLDEIVKGDGYIRKDGNYQYYTSSWRLASDIQEIALKLGYGSTLWEDKRKHGWTKHKAYIITITRKEEPVFKVTGQEIRYDGMMHCIGVPNEIIFVQRNGKPLWCGNTGG